MVNACNKIGQMYTEDLYISCKFYLKRKGGYTDTYDLLLNTSKARCVYTYS